MDLKLDWNGLKLGSDPIISGFKVLCSVRYLGSVNGLTNSVTRAFHPQYQCQFCLVYRICPPAVHRDTHFHFCLFMFISVHESFNSCGLRVEVLWCNYQTDASRARAVSSSIKDRSAVLAMNQWLIKMFAKSVSDIEPVLTRVASGVLL